MIESVDQIIQSGNVPPILFIFGEEDFLIEESLAKLIAYLLPTEHSRYDFDMLDGDDTSQNIIVSKASSYPMANDRRVVVVRRVEKLFTSRSKKPDKNSPISSYLKNPSPSTVLIFVSNTDAFTGISAGLKGKNIDKAKKQIENAKFPYNEILSKYEWIEFPKIWESNLPSWISQRVKSYGKTISQDAVELLFAQTPPSLRDLSNEIEKICLFIQDQKNISVEDVGKIAGSSRSNNVFELQNAVGERNLKKSLTILYNMLASEKQEMLIITMLTRYFLAVWKLQEAAAATNNNSELAGKVGVNPFFLKDYRAAASKYSPTMVNNAIIALCDADLELKSSGFDNLLTMQNLLTKIIQGKD